MFKESLISFVIIGGFALILMTFTSGQHVKGFTNTTTVAAVVEDFNCTKHLKARAWDVSVETMPEISEEEVLASLGRQYAAADVSSDQRQTLEEAICTQRLPVCTHIRVAESDVLDSEVQLELRFGHSETSHWYLGVGKLSSFSVPVEL